jgi:hypothetical protein
VVRRVDDRRKDAHSDLRLATPKHFTPSDTVSKRSESIAYTIPHDDVIDTVDEDGRERTQPEQHGACDGEQRGEEKVDGWTGFTTLDGSGGVCHTGLGVVGGRGPVLVSVAKDHGGQVGG